MKRRVDPSVYTKEYYLSDCTGFTEFKKSFGEILEPRFKEFIKYFKISPKMKILDIGCGRGEMVLYVIKNGAKAVGIDYANDSIELAKLLKSKQDKTIQSKMSFKVMDAKKLKFRNSTFDMVIMTDVVEHLYPEELDEVFQQIKRVLKRDGLLLIHTAPNKWFNNIAYRFYSYPVSLILVKIWNRIANKHYPNIAEPQDLRTDSHVIMHINEPTYFSLKALFKKYNFKGSIISSNVTAKKPHFGIKDDIFNFLVFLHPLSKRFPLNIFFGSDFISILRNIK